MSCETALQVILDSFAAYETQNAAYATAKANYTTDFHEYQRKKSDWDTKLATKKTELENEQKTWNNCVLWTGVYNHDNWCQNDTQFGKQSGAGQEGCALGSGKGYCQRTSDQVASELNTWKGSNPEPVPPIGGVNGVYQTCETPCNPPAGNNIVCCEQNFSDITAKNLNIEAAQSCIQELKNLGLPKVPLGDPKVPEKVLTPKVIPKAGDEVKDEDSSNTLIIISIIIFIIVIIGLLLILI
jgi:hypothetical protein